MSNGLGPRSSDEARRPRALGTVSARYRACSLLVSFCRNEPVPVPSNKAELQEEMMLELMTV